MLVLPDLQISFSSASNPGTVATRAQLAQQFSFLSSHRLAVHGMHSGMPAAERGATMHAMLKEPDSPDISGKLMVACMHLLHAVRLNIT